MKSEQKQNKSKEAYVEPLVLATYSKAELEETIRTEGSFEVSVNATN